MKNDLAMNLTIRSKLSDIITYHVVILNVILYGNMLKRYEIRQTTHRP